MLFVGDEWAEDHHDVEVLDEHGWRLLRARLPEGIEASAACTRCWLALRRARRRDLDARTSDLPGC